jgi:hypothetical protein
LYGERKYTAAIGEWTSAKVYTANLAYLDKLISRAKEQMRREAEDKRLRAEAAAKRARDEELRAKDEAARKKKEEEDARLAAAAGEAALPKATTEANRRTAVQHYLDGLKYFQNSYFEKARDEWVIAKQLDPGNADVESGLKRIDQIQAGGQ